MQFEVDGDKYEGFEPASFDNIPKHNCALVLAWFDGEPDMWWIESLDKVELLRQYYRKTIGMRLIPFTICLIVEPATT